MSHAELVGLAAHDRGVDARLRQLERQRFSDDPTTRHQFLTERVRAGRVAPDALRLAAYCGHAGARMILGPGAPEQPTTSKAWFLGLAPFGLRVVVVTAIVTGRLVEPAWEHRGLWLAIEALRSTEQWLACPCARHRRRAADLARFAKPPPAATTARTAARIAATACRLDRSRSQQAQAARLGAQDASAAAWSAPDVFAGVSADEVAVLVAACGLTKVPTPAEMRGLVAARLGAWVLGELGRERPARQEAPERAAEQRSLLR